MVPEPTSVGRSVSEIREGFERPVKMRKPGRRQPRPNSLDLLDGSGIVANRRTIFDQFNCQWIIQSLGTPTNFLLWVWAIFSKNNWENYFYFSYPTCQNQWFIRYTTCNLKESTQTRVWFEARWPFQISNSGFCFDFFQSPFQFQIYVLYTDIVITIRE